ncbi:TRP-domain-containing protein [Trametopsis cervina]|nr:TRP-domain-containing protein [Trametopsis cervina]
MPFMFFSVARSRLFIASLLALSHVTDAHLNSLFTSSVSYCAPPESILIQQFDVAYIEHNRSVVFNVSAASVLPNVNVSADLFVNVYGMRPFTLSLDLCSLFSGALCPLPTYNFTGADSITLPSSVNVASHLPGIAYVIPDLEAFAQLTLTEVGTGKTRACIQSTLSNGWSARQTAVEWTTASVALLALASAIGWSLVQPSALAPVRLLDMMYLFQTIAASGLLGLNYSSVYRAFTLNFAWSLGLFTMSPTSSIQRSISHMRSLTGGTVSSLESGSGAISLVNRKLSPYNTNALAEVNSLFASSFFANNVSAGLTSPTNFVVGGNVATVTQESSNVLEAGIPIYTNVLGIATANAFTTIFLIALIFVAISIFFLGIGYLAILSLSRTSFGTRRQLTLERARAGYPAFARAWALRVSLICVLPVFIFAFHQWTLHDSWLAVFLSVVTLLAVLLCTVTPILFLLRPAIFSRWVGEVDPSESTILLPLTASLRSQRYLYVLALFTATLVKSIVIAFGQAHGMVQTIINLVVEFLLLGVILALRPHRTRGADVLATFLAIFRVLCTGPMIAFSESLALDAIPRVVVGIVIAVVYSIAVVVMFFNILVNLGLFRFLPWRRNRNVPTDATALSSHPSLEEGKGEKIESPASSTHKTLYERPGNPAPTHTPSTVSPVSPVTTLSQFSEPPTVYTPTTATSTTTLGEELPRRWSSRHSRPPSTSAVSHYSGGLSPRWPVTPGTTESEYTTPRESWRRSSSAHEHNAIPEHTAM